jgi:uncharacterized membrane protein YeaQ/YmgE (transglycosylase-associated protein family)
VLILGIIGIGMLIGALAQLALGGGGRDGFNWGLALVAGIVGSFIGGLLASLIAGDGLALRPSGLIGSFVGALIITAIWKWVGGRNAQPATRRR